MPDGAGGDRTRRPPVTIALAAVLLAGPVVLAFSSGGYFDGPRLVALAVTSLVLAVLALGAPSGDLLPAGHGAQAALGGLLLFTGWVALSRGRSVLPDVAGHDAERVLLYAAFLVAGSVVWRDRRTARLVEPAVAAGILVVMLYGLLGRWLPGLVELTATPAAGGRLEQPLTYWNAEGLLAAVGVVLCLRIAGDAARGADGRAAAAAGAVPLLCCVYLSFSRGALAALAAGLIVLVVCAPSRGQVRAAAAALLAGGVAVAACAILPGVRALEGSADARQRDGLVSLAVTLLGAGIAAVLTDRVRRQEAREGSRVIVLPAAARWLAAVLVVLTVAVPVLVARSGGDVGVAGQPRFGASTQRFSSLGSNRYAYWRVAAGAFREHPLVGIGSGGFKARWLRERKIADLARDAHSLELETLAELGLVGFGLLLLAFGGIAACAASVQRRDPGLAAGACAGMTVWLIHSALDWDWELPAATLPVLALAGMLVARSRAQPPPAGVVG